MVSLDQLPLTVETKRALEAWSEDLWGLFDADLSQAGDLRDREQAHARQGLRLWRAVRDELGPGFEVGYAVFDPHPEDEFAATKRIVWDPKDLS
jgi:hypothetical protein